MNLSQMLNELDAVKAIMIGLVLCGIYYSVAYDDGTKTHKQNEAIEKDIEKVRTETIKVEKDLQRAKDLLATIQALGPKFEQLTALIPRDLTSPTLMQKISTEAKVAGLNIRTLREASAQAQRKDTRKRGRRGAPVEEPKEFYQKLSIGVNLEGTFTQLMSFMSALTQTGQIITFEKFTLNTIGQPLQGESPMLNYSATINGYRYSLDDETEKGK